MHKMLQREDSYYQDFLRRRKSQTRSQTQTNLRLPRESYTADSSAPSQSRLMTDREAYLAYLEVQLERVTAANMTVTGYGQRLEEMQASVTSHEEKLTNLTKLVKLSQQLAEDLAGEARDYREKADKSVTAAERSAKASADEARAHVATVTTASKRVDDMEDRIENTEKSLSNSVESLRKGTKSSVSEMNERVGSVESAVSDINNVLKVWEHRWNESQATVVELKKYVDGIIPDIEHVRERVGDVATEIEGVKVDVQRSRMEAERVVRELEIKSKEAAAWENMVNEQLKATSETQTEMEEVKVVRHDVEFPRQSPIVRRVHYEEEEVVPEEEVEEDEEEAEEMTMSRIRALESSLSKLRTAVKEMESSPVHKSFSKLLTEPAEDIPRKKKEGKSRRQRKSKTENKDDMERQRRKETLKDLYRQVAALELAELKEKKR